MRTAALVCALLVTGCATAPVVDPPTALNGHELDTALNLYGRWDQKVVLQGRPYYVWRRAVVLNGQSYYCELRAEVGFRDTIKSSVVEGYPAACGLFAVKYTTAYERPRSKALPHADATVAEADRPAFPRNYRPVGSPVQSASVTSDATPASDTPP
jgi:hypothetical protein